MIFLSLEPHFSALTYSDFHKILHEVNGHIWHWSAKISSLYIKKLGRKKVKINLLVGKKTGSFIFWVPKDFSIFTIFYLYIKRIPLHVHTNSRGCTWSINMVLEVKNVKKGIFRQVFWWHFYMVQPLKKLRLDSCSPSNFTNFKMLCYRGLTIFFWSRNSSCPDDGYLFILPVGSVRAGFYCTVQDD